MLAARAQGAKHRRIIIREVLPNVLPAMFSIALLGIAVAIVAEGRLAHPRRERRAPTRPRGATSSPSAAATCSDAPHIVFEPALVIFFTVLALNYLGDVVRARFDVRESGL